MTHDERREQKMRLRIDLEDEENNLNHLREKARGRADLILQFGRWLIESPEIHIYRDNVSIHGGLNVQPLHDKYVRALEIQPALLIANEIRESLAKIRDLKERLARLG